MSKKYFENLLQKHENKSEENDIDLKSRKNEWLNFIHQFYKFIESWFTLYKNNRKLSYNYTDTEITEKYFGTYNVRTMVVDFADQKLTLDPMGTPRKLM